MSKIYWWRTNFGEEEISHVVQSMRNECISQGEVTKEFEKKLADFLEVEHVIAVSSGSSALLMSLMAIGVGPGSEVILPNRTWIATAHAVHLLGAKVILVDTEKHRPIIDAELIEEKINSKTKAIIPVHMNGRSCDMQKIKKISKKYGIAIIEDAAQAIASKNSDGFLGTQSDIGCFSLSVAKTIATGQGGFSVTNNNEMADKMRAIRTHGVENIKDPSGWIMPGFNFRFTDLLASIGIEQLKRLPYRVERLREIYHIYSNRLKDSDFSQISVDIDNGEVPVYSEFIINNREEWIARLERIGIETRPFYPDINKAKYLNNKPEESFSNSQHFSKFGIYLPSGPSQSLNDIRYCTNQIININKNN
jgi:dTDP-4-amino-4,6-dideoxygalactose transaminase